MTRIYLIRHAEAEGNLYRIAQGQVQSDLTERGRAQVQALSRRFASIHIDAVYSSDLYRACATAGAIYQPKGLPLHKDRSLREANLGEWEQKPWGEIARQDPEQLICFSVKTHLWHVNGAETAAEVQSRMLAAIRRIAGENDGKTIAVVSHGFAIRMLLGMLQGYPLERIGESPQEDNTAVSLLEAVDGDLRVIFRGDNSHLHDSACTDKKISRKRASELEEGMYYRPLCLPEQAELLRQMGAAAWADAGETRPFDETRLLTDAADRYMILGYANSDTPAALLQMADVGWISLLYVLPEERRQGLGVQLIGQAVHRTLTLGGTSLRIALRKNNPARSLLAENAFVPAGETCDGRVILEKKLCCAPEYDPET